MAAKQFAFSASRRYRDRSLTKTAAGDEYCALFDHEYGNAITADDLAAVQDGLSHCFERLAGQTGFLAQVTAGSRHKFEPRLQFRFDEISITAIPDLVFLRPDRGLTVVDWKVGNSDSSDYSYQLLVYAMAVLRSGWWQAIEPESIELWEMNLLKNQVRPHPVTAQRIDEIEDFIYSSLTQLRYLVGAEKYDGLDIEEFEAAEQPQTCYHCNFRILCLSKLQPANS